MSAIMKQFISVISLLIFLTPCFAQIEVRDSIFVRLDRLHPDKLSFDVKGGKLVHVGVFIKNKYEDVTSFYATKNHSDLALIKVESVNPSKVVAYSVFNSMLNSDFLNTLFYTKVYFILSKSKEDFLVLWVQPKLPGALNKH